MYEMKPEYYTGIAQIDEEHKKLFEIADEAYELYKNEFIPDKYDHIAKILNELRDYTKIHFQHEEEYMKTLITRECSCRRYSTTSSARS